MRTRWQVLVTMAAAVVLRSAAATAGEDPTAPMRGVRALDPAVAAVLTAGLERSATLRMLVKAIEAGDGIVTVESVSRYRLMRAGLVGATSHDIAAAGTVRIVRVSLVTGRGDAEIATLAHELQHVNEILGSGARNRSEVDALYLRIGNVVRPGVFETAAAQETDGRVWRELKRR